MAEKKIEVIIEAVDNASKPLEQVGKTIAQQQQSLQSYGKAMAAVGVGFGVLGKLSLDLGKDLIASSNEMEQQRVSFETLTGSVQQGRKTLQELLDFASKTPFEIPQIMEQSKRLLAMGTSASDLIPVFKSLGDIASGVGMEKLPQLVLAFGQIQARGRLMGTELRQLTEAGFNLADAMGISNEKLTELVEDKAVSFEDVKNAMVSVTQEGGRFYNMMQNQAGTTAGKLSNLSDSVFRLKSAIGDQLRPAVTGIVDALIPFISTLATFAQKNPELVKAITIFIGVLTTLGVVVGIVGAAILLFTASFGGLALTIGGVIVAIAALVAVGYMIMHHWEQLRTMASQIWSTIVTTITGWVTTMGTMIQQALLTVQTFFVNIWLAIQAWFIAFWQNLTQNILFQLLMNVVLLIISIGALILELFRFTWTAITAVIEIALYAIAAVIQAVLTAVWSFISAIFTMIKAFILTIWNAIKDDVMRILNAIKAFIELIFNAIFTFVSGIMEKIRSWIKTKIDESAEAIRSGVENMKSFFNSLLGVINSVIDKFRSMADAARDALSAARNAISGAVGNIKDRLGFQHGGVIPGSFNQPVPAILHGGERIVSRTGVDANQGSGGGGGPINIIIEGDVNSMDTLDKIIAAVSAATGRENELARLGVAI